MKAQTAVFTWSRLYKDSLFCGGQAVHWATIAIMQHASMDARSTEFRLLREVCALSHDYIDIDNMTVLPLLLKFGDAKT